MVLSDEDGPYASRKRLVAFNSLIEFVYYRDTFSVYLVFLFHHINASEMNWTLKYRSILEQSMYDHENSLCSVLKSGSSVYVFPLWIIMKSVDFVWMFHLF